MREVPTLTLHEATRAFKASKLLEDILHYEPTKSSHRHSYTLIWLCYCYVLWWYCYDSVELSYTTVYPILLRYK